MANTNRYLSIIIDLCQEWHWTAEQVHIALRNRYPRALTSLGTVYRNLTALVNEGILMKQHTLGDKMIYEKAKPPHGHIFCQNAWVMIDIDVSALSFAGVQLPADFVLEDVQVTFAGSFQGTESAYCQLTGKVLRK